MNSIELDTDLLALLPPWYQEVLDYQQICQTEAEQLNALADEIIAVADNMFFQTMDESAISLWEQVLQIVPNPTTEDLAFRRYRVINRLSTRPPFTIWFLCQKLDELIGPNEWAVNIDYPNYSMTIQTPLQNAIYETETRYTVNRIKPAHIAWNIQYVDVKNAPIYVGSYARSAVTAITDITMPRQGDAQSYIGTYARSATVAVVNITV